MPAAERVLYDQLCVAALFFSDYVVVQLKSYIKHNVNVCRKKMIKRKRGNTMQLSNLVDGFYIKINQCVFIVMLLK